ncbi:MAG: VOC family protein [Planctomycetota bacterium]
MSEGTSSPGTIVWQDLTVPDAAELRGFYGAVAGWTFGEHSMGDYDDYTVHASEGGPCVGGLCHARGGNAKIPPAWLIYIEVEDVRASAQACVDNGGTLIDGPRAMGKQLFFAFRDPAGAVAAIIGPNPDAS